MRITTSIVRVLVAVTGLGMGFAAFAAQRVPDYTRARDWAFNHVLKPELRALAGEAAADNGVDLIYIYPTVAMTNAATTVNGFVDIDDPQIRGNEAKHIGGAWGAYDQQGRVFGDMTRVFAPFYRQISLAAASATAGADYAKGHATYLTKLHEGPAFQDVTAALDTYFAKWNNGRKFVLAGHSQGSAVLHTIMEHYFTRPENLPKLKNLVVSYQLGYGVGKGWLAKLERATKFEGFDGVKFAAGATDTGVIVSWNVTGPNVEGSGILRPADAVSINPLSWSLGTERADKKLNLGALTNVSKRAIAVHYCDAQVNVQWGTVMSHEIPARDYLDQVFPPFGRESLHTWDYRAYWENLHLNCYERIAAATGLRPRVGRPTDYSKRENWMRLPADPANPEKPLDVFYLYPTSTPSTDYIGGIDAMMKKRATVSYLKGPGALEGKVNMYAPWYRQVAVSGIISDPTADGLQRCVATHVVKTDVFAALDRYFTLYNPGGKRPFVLTSHSQGSCNLKVAFEEYFIGAKKQYLKNMVAVYAIGYTFPKSWCAKVGVPFARGRTDTGVIITWNAEGPHAKLGTNMLTKAPDGQAINPLNWKTDGTPAKRSENLGSVAMDAKGQLSDVPGAADAQLKADRPGVVVVTDTEFKCSPPLFGIESYHLDDWGLYRENACRNILERAAALRGE